MIAVIPAEGWAAINTLGLVCLGLIAIYNARQIKAVDVKVDGPLSLALKNNELLTKRVADLTGDHADVKAAMEAKAINENRIEGKVGIATIEDHKLKS